MNKPEVITPVLIGADEVAAILGVKISTAYKVIRTLNSQLEARGKVTVRGKINRRYLLKMVDHQEAS
ncbi:MAG: DNA-binding protein [Phascolarctobacterium sp.]|nr:DNA-binding protein [Phascolarctobacterium sp.]